MILNFFKKIISSIGAFIAVVTGLDVFFTKESEPLKKGDAESKENITIN